MKLLFQMCCPCKYRLHGDRFTVTVTHEQDLETTLQILATGSPLIEKWFGALKGQTNPEGQAKRRNKKTNKQKPRNVTQGNWLDDQRQR